MIRPLEQQFNKLPPLDQYHKLLERTERISKRNTILIKKILNLRKKVYAHYYLSSKKSENRSEEEYIFSLKNLMEVKKNAKNTYFDLQREKLLNPKPEKPHSPQQQHPSLKPP